MKFVITTLFVGIFASLAHAQNLPSLNLICAAQNPQIAKLRIRGPVDQSGYIVGFMAEPSGLRSGRVSNLLSDQGQTAFDLDWTDGLNTNHKIKLLVESEESVRTRYVSHGLSVDFTCKRGPDLDPFPGVTVGN